MTIAEHITRCRRLYVLLAAAGVVLVVCAGIVLEASLELQPFRIIGGLGLALMLVSWAYGYLTLRCPVCGKSLISPMWVGPPFLPIYASCPRCQTDFAQQMPGK